MGKAKLSVTINNKVCTGGHGCPCSLCVADSALGASLVDWRSKSRANRTSLGRVSRVVPYHRGQESEGEMVEWWENRRGDGRTSNAQSCFDMASEADFKYLLSLVAMSRGQLEEHLRELFMRATK